MSYTFPKNFLWGAATSSHQIEGGLINNWTVWEEKNAQYLSKKGQKPKEETFFKQSCEPEAYISNSKYSCESFNYWDRDLEVIKKLNLKAYRLSIEWARIQPEKDVWDLEAIKCYKEYLKELKKNNIKVVLTCWHWTLPIWVDKEGGLLSKNIYRYFNRYVKRLAEEFAPYVDYWITINEPESFIFSYLIGTWPPGIRNPFVFNRVFSIVLPKMHKRSYRTIKSTDPKKPVSLAKSFWYISPYNDHPWNKLIAKVFDWYINTSFLDRVKRYTDFLGINFYFHNKVGIRGLRNDNDRVSDMGWWLDPSKLYDLLVKVHDRYKKPIFITENGLAEDDEENRVWWITETVSAMNKAIHENKIPIIGYLHWSLLDNFEWDKGFWPKFGLVKVDPETKERIIKEGGIFYSKVIDTNGDI